MVSGIRNGLPKSALRLATFLPLAVSALALSSCDGGSDSSMVGPHNASTVPGFLGQRIVYCDDGSRADVDYLVDGLQMAVTWLPHGKTQILRANRTGEEFRSRHLKAIVAGKSIAFTFSNKRIRACHPIEEGG